MLSTKQISKSIIFSLILVWNVSASEYVPDVYQDDYIIVRAGIEEAGRVPVHLGDKLSLVIEAEFSGNEVIVEDLDEQLFERSWGSEKGIRLIHAPEIVRTQEANGITILRSIFSFQVVDCPGEFTSCRGNKTYALPVFSLGYQIVDVSGNVVNNKSVRFNPEPDSVVVMQALDIRGEGGLEKLSTYLGNAGYPAALELIKDNESGMWPLLIGGLIFMVSFFPVLFSKNTTRRTDDPRRARNRWEKVLVFAEDKSNELSDEEWSDLLRRCVTWYCMDEYNINPYTWLSDGNSEGESQAVSNLRAYFFEVLNQEGIDKTLRSDYVNKFSALTSSLA
jgi:hypothetical protein